MATSGTPPPPFGDYYREIYARLSAISSASSPTPG
jgi:hypothetical protein